MQIKQPVFPLSETAFGAALKTGHGRAMQQIVRHGAVGLEALIIEACLTCVSYDPQCEAPRAPWLCSLVDRAQMNEKVVKEIEAAQITLPSDDHRDLEQRSAILKELAASGSKNARRLLYSSLARFPGTASVIGAEEIVALDGVEGLIYVSRQLGRWLQLDHDFWTDDCLITQLDAASGTEVGLAALERVAMVDPDVGSFLAGVRSYRESRSSGATHAAWSALTAGEVVSYINSSPREQCYWLRRWGAQASHDQREIVFAALLASEQSEHVKRLFRCFTKTGVPRFDRRLLRWIDHSVGQVEWAAVAALAPLTHGDLRHAARRLIADGNIASGIKLLVNNFEDGDLAVCAEHLTLDEDIDQTHHLVGNVLDLCEAHPGERTLDCLLYVYEFSPCSTCRQRAVKALIDMSSTPAWVLAESAFDADPDTRVIIGACYPCEPC
jgi:hypothetical protein